jgi:hypothetical protein
VNFFLLPGFVMSESKSNVCESWVKRIQKFVNNFPKQLIKALHMAYLHTSRLCTAAIYNAMAYLAKAVRASFAESENLPCIAFRAAVDNFRRRFD